MRQADAFVVFKEWLPDIPELGNPGLTEAQNVIPVDGTYKPYSPLVAHSATLNATCNGVYVARDSGARVVVAAVSGTTGAGSLQWLQSAGSWVTIGSGLTATESSYWGFAQFEDLLVFMPPGSVSTALAITIDSIGVGASVSSLATTGALPTFPRYPAVIGQFLVIGNLDNRVQWSAIGDPRNWPTPGSATASAVQSGAQDLPSEFGELTGVTAGDQFGLVFQRDAITRMTYVGGGTVFQFDTLQQRIGAYFPRSIVQVGGFVYFASANGFFRTDGTSIESIGYGKVDTYFASRVERIESSVRRGLLTAAVDQANELIYWSFPLDSDGSPPAHATQLLIYNYQENRWSMAQQAARLLFDNKAEDGLVDGEQFLGVGGVTTLNAIAYMNGTAGSAVLTTGEVEHVPGLFATVQGVKPLVSGTTPSMTVAVGTRNTQDPTALTYTSESTAHSATGFAGFRSSARYHRARFTITGNFDKAQGYEWQAVPDGAR